MKEFDELLKREPVDPLILKEVDPEYLLNKYGPEGLYDLAKELMKVADKDISDALSDDINSWDDGGCSTGLGDPWTCDDCGNSVYNCKCSNP